MDGKRFDDLARDLHEQLRRRDVLQRALKVGAGSAVGLAGVAASVDPALGKKCKKKKDCPKGKKCKHKKNGKGHCK
jgi:hypothetical protein